MDRLNWLRRPNRLHSRADVIAPPSPVPNSPELTVGSFVRCPPLCRWTVAYTSTV